MPSALHRQALQIFRAALKAADPRAAVLRNVKVDGDRVLVGSQRYSFEAFDRIFVIGAGKASAAMGQGIERLFGRRIAGGLINVKYGHTVPLRRLELNECGHPVPDRNGVRGATRIANIAREAGPRDLLVCVISGGASALLPLPASGISLADKQRTTQLLLESGATIHEFNCVRKHLSAIKGGQLAALASPAHLITLILSDVIGDDLDVIGSGPTVPDPSTFEQAAAILRKYHLLNRVPPDVRKRLTKGAERETPKPGDRVFAHVQNLVVGSNRLAVTAAEQKARALGFNTLVLSTSIAGEARDVARVHAAIAREISESGRPLKPPACIISGGETTVTLRGRGKGGRNQEFALAAALDITGLQRVAICSAGTDGSDGPTDAAGAVVDGDTVADAAKAGLNAAASLADNDSYNFFQRAGGLVRTGPTGTNVMDIQLVLCG